MAISAQKSRIILKRIPEKQSGTTRESARKTGTAYSVPRRARRSGKLVAFAAAWTERAVPFFRPVRSMLDCRRILERDWDDAMRSQIREEDEPGPLSNALGSRSLPINDRYNARTTDARKQGTAYSVPRRHARSRKHSSLPAPRGQSGLSPFFAPSTSWGQRPIS